MKASVFILSLFLSFFALGQTLQHGSLHQGSYKVMEAKRLASGEYFIIWEALEKKNQPTDRLHLQASESHMDVRVGRMMNLSVVVDKVNDAFVEVMQVHVKFKDGRRVWLLSQAGKKEPLQGESYLQMHAPRSDYQVL